MLNNKYNPKDLEKNQGDKWAKTRIYKWNNTSDNNYVIDTPPPTISGSLHIGHIFSYCHTDFIARYNRMKGKDVFYPMGFDDNGLPTERLVEKKFKIKAGTEDRTEFLKKCHDVSQESRAIFKDLFNKIGLSIDWSLEYNTNSETSHKISQMSFLELYKKGLIYRKSTPMLWDSIDQTAIAQAEVEEKEFQSHMNYIAFKIADTTYEIATTRPELLPACVALLYNPEDERYLHLKGKDAIVPLFNFKVPLIADEEVKIDKGSGLVMCCTYGDEQDLIWKERHDLAEKIIINKYGKINLEHIIQTEVHNYAGDSSLANIINQLQKLKVKDARIKIIELLKDTGDLQKQEEISHYVKCAERSGIQLELIPTEQWYIKILPFKDELLEIGESIVNWYPQSMSNRYVQWVDSLKWDWCISRQRFLGVPIPAWKHKNTGEIILPEMEDLPINPNIDLPKGFNKDEIIPVKDVMDTWATSSLTPNINALGINEIFSLEKTRTQKLLPADLRPQAHEIIRTWAFYTIAKTFLHNKDQQEKYPMPWKNIMISGWCLSKDQQKMSKSKGNIIAPLELIERFGADPIRYWSATANLGTDTVFSEDVIKNGKRLVTKLINVARFVSNFEIIKKPDIKKITAPVDVWAITKFAEYINIFEEVMDNRLDYCRAKYFAEEFFWKILCDNYIELAKKRLYTTQDNKTSDGETALHALNYMMIGALKMFAPFLPFVTDYLYEYLYSERSIHAKGSWLENHKEIISSHDPEKYFLGEIACQILEEIRSWKSKKQISIKKQISKIVLNTSPQSQIKNESKVDADDNAIDNSKKLSTDSIIKTDNSKVSLWMKNMKNAEFDLIHACNVSEVEYKEGDNTDKVILDIFE
ncbi:valine--tRNA ligase [Anaplasmataceae bacterium AB001_6]|nr:valine--tRNA ligase [Anaplasmataceae bacterium AB001_6]